MQARNILLDAKKDANEIIQKMNSLSSYKDLENARNALNNKIREINDISDDINNTNLNDTKNALSAQNIKLNVTSIGQNGIVLSHVSKSNEVQVQIGSLKINVPVKYLSLPTNNVKNTSSDVNNFSSISKTKTVKSEINVIGLNVEEAIFVVDKFLDDCSLAKLQNVRIVHGKGTGKLRNRHS